MSSRGWALLVVLVSTALKIGVFFAVYAHGPDRIVTQDTPSYERPALALVETGHFAVDAAHPDVPATLVPPGYPAFIAVLYRVAGERRTAVVLAQIAASGLTQWLVFLAAARLWGPAAGLRALTLLALDLVSFTYAQILFADSLFTALLMCAVYAAVAHLLTERVRWAAAFGVALAVTTLVRPITYYLFWPVLAGILVWQWRRGTPVRRMAAIAVAAALPWLALVGGWRARNDRLVGRAQLSDIQSVNLFLYRAAGVIALRDGISFYDAQQQITKRLPDLDGLSKGQIDTLYEREALRVFASNPGLLAQMELFGLVKVVAGTARAEILHYYGGEPYELAPAGAVGITLDEIRGKFRGHAWAAIPVAYIALHLVLVYAAAVYGLGLAWTRPGSARAAAVLIAAIAVYLMLIAAGPEAYARFRVPVMPCLALFGGLGLAGHLRRVPPAAVPSSPSSPAP